jgi:hypothetical protein
MALSITAEEVSGITAKRTELFSVFVNESLHTISDLIRSSANNFGHNSVVYELPQYDCKQINKTDFEMIVCSSILKALMAAGFATWLCMDDKKMRFLICWQVSVSKAEKDTMMELIRSRTIDTATLNHLKKTGLRRPEDYKSTLAPKRAPPKAEPPERKAPEDEETPLSIAARWAAEPKTSGATTTPPGKTGAPAPKTPAENGGPPPRS